MMTGLSRPWTDVSYSFPSLIGMHKVSTKCCPQILHSKKIVD